MRASVVCYHCGHISGAVEASAGDPLTSGVFVPTGAVQTVALGGRAVRCSRCRGPTYLDDVQPIRERQQRLVTWRGRGRPPRNAIRIELPPEAGTKRRRPIVLYGLLVDGQA